MLQNMRHWIEKRAHFGELAKIRQAETEEKRRADEIGMVEIQAEEKKKFDGIKMSPTDEAAKDQAKIQAEKELALKELELKAKGSSTYQCCS